MLIKIFKSQRGFGFFGMMVLVIVMGVLGSIVMVSIDTTVANQGMQETVSKMERIQKAVAKFRLDDTAGAAPATLADLIADLGVATPCQSTTALALSSSRARGWCGPYLEVPVSNDPTDYATDGWGTTFYYTPGGATATLRSWGPNRTDNTGGVDDITRTF